MNLARSLTGPLAQRAVLPAFAASLFLSAGLMFLVEPMLGKLLLPRLGGSTAVWSTCLVFYQTVLLLGYAYAHALVRLLPRSGQLVIHGGVLLCAAALLPVGIGPGEPPPGDSPVWWLLWRLAAGAGLPLFAIAATSPLLQSWFARLERTDAPDPYFLYASSNAGSLLALLAYPFAIEPWLTLQRQAQLWSLGFGALMAVIALCALAANRRASPATAPAVPASHASRPGLERLTWIVLALVPSSLLLGVTTHISTDIAATPLLWVALLAIYLLTFVLAFAARPPLRHAWMLRAMRMLLVLLVVLGAPGAARTVVPQLLLALHLACFFAIAMACHGELARRRPPAARLTEFYFFLALGGVLGGIFNALLAPLIFSDVAEYPLALIAASAIVPAGLHQPSRRGLLFDVVLPGVLLALVLVAQRAAAGEGESVSPVAAAFGYLLPAIALVNFSQRRWRFALGVAACLLAARLSQPGSTVATERSFYGVTRIRTINDGAGPLMVMMNGTTLHGAKSLLPGDERLPLAYYSREGPFGRVFADLPAAAIHRVAVVGLGTGELGCYARPGQAWTFYEIDPVVLRIARDDRYFGFLNQCGNRPRVVLGDARLTLNAAPDGAYDVIVLDAFSSDSVPMHLLTREAVALYLRKLAPGGQLAFHISSRVLDLRPIVAALAEDADLSAWVLLGPPPQSATRWRREPALVVALARRGQDAGRHDPADGWRPLAPSGRWALWTDQRSDILAAFAGVARWLAAVAPP